MIQGHGYLSAPIMLVADGASDDDVASGYAISGYQENKLKEFAADNGIRWESETYRTAFIKERIKLTEPKANYSLVNDQYKKILLDEIKVVDPNIIVPMSELSFNYLTNLSDINKFRGSLLPSVHGRAKILPVLGIYPYLNQDFKMSFITRLDFGKIARYRDDHKPWKDENVWVCKSGQQLYNYISRQYNKCQFLVFDIETYCGIPTCISLCFDDEESCTVPLLDREISFAERSIMMHHVINLLASPIPKVNQNIKFDWRKLERFRFYVENIIGDTLLATSCLYCEFPKNLGFLTSIYTDMPYFKDEGKQFDPSIHDRSRLFLYCAKDSLATHRIYTQQQKELKETGTLPVYNKLIEILPLYKKMEQRGILIDDSARVSLTAKYETLFNIQEYKLKSLINRTTFNVMSSIQCQRLVYDEIGFRPVRGVKYTKSGNPAADEESLEMLIWMGDGLESSNEILRCIIACRKIHKVIEYLRTPLHPDGRLRCEFNLGGSENGRTTASHTTDNLLTFVTEKKRVIVKTIDLGRSFQTIAKHGFDIDGFEYGKDLRSMFVPSPGYCFVECDLSQAEARVDAVLANDFEILKVFDGPIGIHRLTGSWIFACEPLEIKKGTRQYHEAKTARHAGERNMTETRLMMMIHQPIKFCTQVLRTFHAKQPNIRGVFHDEIRYHLQREKCLVAPNGRRRDFFGRYDKDQINEAISFLPQAIVTDYLKYGLRRTFDNYSQCEPISEAHDGFLAEVPIMERESYAAEFRRNTEIPIDFSTCSLSRDFKLTIPLETEWSDTNWMEMKGMKI